MPHSKFIIVSLLHTVNLTIPRYNTQYSTLQQVDTPDQSRCSNQLQLPSDRQSHPLGNDTAQVHQAQILVQRCSYLLQLPSDIALFYKIVPPRVMIQRRYTKHRSSCSHKTLNRPLIMMLVAGNSVTRSSNKKLPNLKKLCFQDSPKGDQTFGIVL